MYFPAMKKIKAGRGIYVTVDDNDYEFLRAFKVWAVRQPTNTYAVVSVCGHAIPLHRFLLNAKKNWVVDHINNDGLDNRRENLRLASESQNRANRRYRRKGSKQKYLGVLKRVRGGRTVYAAVTTKNACQRVHGYFDTEEEAARARDTAARAIYGRFAYQNFPPAEDNPHNL